MKRSGFVYYGAQSSSGLLAAVVGHEEEPAYHEIVLYRAEDLAELGQVLRVDGNVTLRCSFHPTDPLLGVGGEDGVVRVIEVPLKDVGTAEVALAGKAKTIYSSEAIQGDNKEIKHVAWHPDGGYLMGSVNDGTWRLWRITPEGLTEHGVFPAASGSTSAAKEGEVLFSCRCAIFHPDGHELYTVHNVRRAPRKYSRAATLVRWAVRVDDEGAMSLNVLGVSTSSSSPVTAMALSERGDYGAMGNGDGEVQVFSTATLKVKARLREAHALPITDLAFRPRSHGARELIVSVGADKTLRVYEPFPESYLCSYIFYLFLFILVGLLLLQFYMQSREGDLAVLRVRLQDWAKVMQSDYRAVH